MNSEKTNIYSQWIVNIGLLLVMTGTALPLLRIGADWFRYIYCAGAVLALLGWIIRKPLGKDAPMRARRLSRMEAWSAIMFCAGGFFMFYNAGGTGRMDWIAFTLAGGAIQIYTSIMLPKALAGKSGKSK